MRVRLLAFASAAQAIGTAACDWQLAGELSVGNLRHRLAVDFPTIAPLLPRLAIAVDGSIATSETLVREGSEIALLPPRLRRLKVRTGLVTLALDIPAMLAAVADPACGAQAIFIGTVRDRNGPDGGREVVAIDYSAYESMAESVLARIATELETASPGLRVMLFHRLGRLAVGEASIAIVATSPRRDGALGAIREALERVKSEAPIWKREIYADGGSGWREVEPLIEPAAPGKDG